MSLKDRLDEDRETSEAWVPEPGQELIGIITRINERQSDVEDRDPYPVYTINPIEGDLKAFHAFHSLASSELVGQDAAVGDEVGIRYLGKTEGKVRNYHNYRIVVEKNKHPIADQESIGATQKALEDETDSIPFLNDGFPSYEDRRQ